MVSVLIALAIAVFAMIQIESKENQPGTWLLRHTKPMQKRIFEEQVKILDLNGYLHVYHSLAVPGTIGSELKLETVPLDTLVVAKRESGITYFSDFAVKAMQIIKSKRTPAENREFGSKAADFTEFRDTVLNLVQTSVRAYAIKQGVSETKITEIYEGKTSKMNETEPVEVVDDPVDPVQLQLEEEQRVLELRQKELETRMKAARLRLLQIGLKLKNNLIEFIEESGVEMPEDVSPKALVDHDLGALIVSTLKATSSQEINFDKIIDVWSEYEILPKANSDDVKGLVQESAGDYESAVLPLLALIHKTHADSEVRGFVDSYVQMLGELSKDVMRVTNTMSRTNLQIMKNIITEAAVEVMVEFGVDILDGLAETLEIY